ncbi:hypothetical protein Cni_G24982 [Canna indica]|uniref:Protein DETOXIFICATION n=1 Tax=Canna indica TaxID=4628 RepID=A0AAQ3QQ36_9LILI|nr:hypothetical protein Cni_G24982 [Canna indica]
MESGGMEEGEEETRGLAGRVGEETKKLWRVGGPAVIIRLSTFGSFIVTQSFVGRCGELELASYGLVFSILIRFSHGIMGLWLGMLCGSVVQTLVLTSITIRTNWDNQVEKAKSRLRRWELSSQDDANNANGETSGRDSR